MKNSLYILRQISETLSNHQTYYTFNKMDEHLSQKYRKGRVNASKWMNELIWMYIEKESQFILEFKEHLQQQKIDISELADGDFKQGLFDELNLIEDLLNDKLNKHYK
jgi:alpha-galactosidase/6-phospho-beta-glucosidase family protein